MWKMFNWLMNEEKGQGTLEYGLILVLVAILSIVALGTLGSGLIDSFTKSGNVVP